MYSPLNTNAYLLFLWIGIWSDPEVIKAGDVEYDRGALMVKAEIHPLESAFFQGGGHAVLCRLFAVYQKEATTTSASNFSTGSSPFQGERIAFIDEAGGEAGGETALLLPGIVEETGELVEVAAFQARLDIYGNLLDIVQCL